MEPGVGSRAGGPIRPSSIIAFGVALCALFSCSAQAQGITTIVSVATGGAEGDDVSTSPAISDDGRFVAFLSYASTLVTGDTNDALDVFVRDRTMGVTTRVSVSTEGVQGDLRSGGYCVIGSRGTYSGLAISGDGRFVAFGSAATNLVADDTNDNDDVFVHDRQTGVTERVSVGPLGVEGNAYSSCPALSADGRHVAFTSQASNLVADDTNGFDDIFVHDRQTGTTTRVNVGPGGVQAEGGSYVRRPAISADGRFVAFESEATNLVAGDTNGMADIFVRDRVGGTTARVSVSTGNSESNGHSYDPAFSADGRYVAFSSEASNLVTGDTNGVKDIFVHDRQAGVTARVSVGLGGAQANNLSNIPAINADGRFVTFESIASNLVLGDTNGVWDVFVLDRVTEATTRVSVGAAQVQGGGMSPAPLSADGRFVAFYSANLVQGIIGAGVFVRDRHAAVRPFAPAGDYDGDGRADVAVYRPWRGMWYIVRSTGAAVGVTWGLPLDLPVPADYDGDGKSDVAVYRPEAGTWYIVQSTTGTRVSLRWGTTWDLPVPADYDGDGKADPAVFRGSTGEWYQIRSTTGAGYRVRWGAPGDLPVPADYDGDGRADPTVFRPSNGTWYQLRSTGGGYGVRWGMADDIPLAGDYDGDGRADPTVYRRSEGSWYELRSLTHTGFRVVWGGTSDEPIVGDYDGDGRMDPTLFRGSTGRWYELRSLTGAGVGVSWGQLGDIPR